MKATAKFLSVAALAAASFGIASAAHAGTDVYFSVGIPAPVYMQPAPVYVQPRPVYVQPQPVYVEPAYVEPRIEYRYEDGWRHGHGRHWQERRYARVYGPYGDMDRDGVPNRYDNYPDNPYRR